MSKNSTVFLLWGHSEMTISSMDMGSIACWTIAELSFPGFIIAYIDMTLFTFYRSVNKGYFFAGSRWRYSAVAMTAVNVSR